MSDVILLSDSNDSIPSTENSNNKNGTKQKETNNLLDDNWSDCDFPEIRFDEIHNTNKERNDSSNDDDYRTNILQDQFPFTLREKESEKFLNAISSDDDLILTYSAPLTQRNVAKDPDELLQLSDNEHFRKDLEDAIDNGKRRKKANEASKKDKAKVAEERLQRQVQLAKNKALKAIASKRSRDIKPGECMKFMEVTLDQGIRNLGFTTEITDALEEAMVPYRIDSQLIPNSITWKRNVEEPYIDEFNKVSVKKTVEDISQMIVIWNWDETVQKVADKTVSESISSIRDLMPDHSLTLVIFGIGKYFTYKRKNQNEFSQRSGIKEKKKNKSNSIAFDSTPFITKKQLEVLLVEIQIMFKCNSRLIDNQQELASIVCQYTKSIAETPFKIEKNKNLKDKFDWYVMGDNKDTVRIDKDGNGLKRLWEQQLRQFNNSSLEIAQAISFTYPSPASLMKAYTNCTESEGINLLKDIAIRRAAGPLTTTRKIGIELSKRIYIMFTAESGDITLR